MSGARCAERASEARARGRTNKSSGRLITAILFGSAARRCSWENRIFCYQMTVRFEVVSAETLVSRTVADASSATSEKLNDVERVRNGGINRRAKSSPEDLLFGGTFSLRFRSASYSLLWVDFEWLEERSRRDKRSVEMNRVALWLAKVLR